MTEQIQKKPRKPRTTKKKLLSQNPIINNDTTNDNTTNDNTTNDNTTNDNTTNDNTTNDNTTNDNNNDNTNNININSQQQETEQKIPKKRGRKPKGGKIVQNNISNTSNNIHKPNIILHLKCCEQDLHKNKFISSLEYEPNIQSVDTFKFDNSKSNELGYSVIDYGNNSSLTSKTDNTISYIVNNSNSESIPTTQSNNKEQHNVKEVDETQQLWDKLKELRYQLHTNTISDKKSDCFWCTCDFDNPMILIPKYELNKTYHCYGCFCSPECASAFLFKETIDNSTKFERYHLLNHIYCKIYNYEKNIKPAPEPFYMLNKYYGNLSIQEYRKLLKNERLLLIVDKPLSRILPELHEDNNDMMSCDSMISSSNKFKLRRKTKQSKTEILSETFNLNN